MAEILVDSNVLLDVLTNDAQWSQWSAETLEQWAESNVLVINAIILAEVSVGFDRFEDVEAALPEHMFQRRAIPAEAAFLAGKCFLKYRRRRGPKRSPLPDFFIGAHAAVGSIPLMTRDVGRYRAYFPKLALISPT